MPYIHPTACVDPAAELGAAVEVGPFSYIGPHVRLADNCVLGPHVTLLGPADFGPRNTFYSGCVLGAAPQDLKYRGGSTRLIVGADNAFREYVTVHRGTEVDQHSGGATRIGAGNLLMVGVHVGHDADIGDCNIIANNVQLAGHVRLENGVVLGGVSGLAQFVTVGRYAYVGGMTRITHDVPPYMKVAGYHQAVRGLNTEGLRRWHFATASITRLRTAARLLYSRRRAGAPPRSEDALRLIESNGLMQDEHVSYLVAFVRRKLAIGVYGRVREHLRSDADTDRSAFYRPPEGQSPDASRVADHGSADAANPAGGRNAIP